MIVFLSDKLYVCAYYTIWSSQEEKKRVLSPLFLYLGSYYTIEMIGSRYKSLEVYTKTLNTRMCRNSNTLIQERTTREEFCYGDIFV